MTPALKQGEIIEVIGWVMLAKLNEGRYRVKDVKKVYGIPAYTFSKPRGTKSIVTHTCANVDRCLRDSRYHPDLNKIIRVTTYKVPLLKEGDPCPTVDCGKVLVIASPSGGYLECAHGHVHAKRVRCQDPGCRRLATSFQNWAGMGCKAFCAAHDNWPTPPRS